jgi:hypothetical protein
MSNEIACCTRCGHVIDEPNDFRVDIGFSIRVDRLKEDTLWEYIPNLDNISREVLCMSCFDRFSDLMSQMNVAYTPAPKATSPLALKLAETKAAKAAASS